MKAAKIATENVELKSKLDEALTEKRIFEEKMLLMETLVNEKNNTDDVAVLRSELQNVQKIMVEDIGEKKEKKLEDLRNDNETLKIELAKLSQASEAKDTQWSQQITQFEGKNFISRT